MAGQALSVVLPAWNEAVKVCGTLAVLRSAFSEAELIVSDDGSTDATAAEAEKVSAVDPKVRVLRNPHRGRGRALQSGLAAASGEVVVTIDADLSYGPEDVRRLFEHLQTHPACDLVIGSCYMPGGRVEGVPARRLLISRWGNVLLRFAFHGQFWTTTGILRGYRREKLQTLLKDPGLVSDGKELYLEFLHKALAAGWKVEEIPATLTWRRGPGGGNFALLRTAGSHLDFLFAQRFCMVFTLAMGLILLPWVRVLGMAQGWYLPVFRFVSSVAGRAFARSLFVFEMRLLFSVFCIAGIASSLLLPHVLVAKISWDHRFVKPLDKVRKAICAPLALLLYALMVLNACALAGFLRVSDAFSLPSP